MSYGKKEIASYIAANNGISKKAAEEILGDAFTYIADLMNNGDEVSIKDFGKFVPVVKPARNGRNPATGATIAIPEKTAVTFKASTALKALVN